MSGDPWLPRLHFVPPGWMNDPNGLVRVGDAWRLYFQYRPLGDDVGRIHWGTALSTDLVHWTHDGIALAASESASAYSGCVVPVPGHPSDLFAFHTANHASAIGPRRQTQQRARSRDGGRSFTPDPAAPVVDEGLPNFRDPFVCRIGDDHVMLVARPDDWDASEAWRGSTLAIYASDDALRQWRPRGDIGPWDAPGVLWEVPWLLEVGLDDSAGWMLAVSTIDRRGAVTKCSTRHWFGHFDGHHFSPASAQAGLPLDYGPDYYAAVPGVRRAAGEACVTVAWIGNWAYARRLPPASWAGGVLSVPRELTCTRHEGRWRLRQRPVAALDDLRRSTGTHTCLVNASAPHALSLPELPCDVEVSLDLGDATGAAVELFDGDLGIAIVDGGAALVMTRRGRQDVPAFAGSWRAERRERTAPVVLRLLIDTCVVEVFADDGDLTFTALVFPRDRRREARLVARGGAVTARLSCTTLVASR